MESEPQVDPQPTVEAPPCRHLRSKGMYIYTDGNYSPHDSYDNTIYWCLRSMKSFGPDDEQVHREFCCDRSRSCYEET